MCVHIKEIAIRGNGELIIIACTLTEKGFEAFTLCLILITAISSFASFNFTTTLIYVVVNLAAINKIAEFFF